MPTTPETVEHNLLNVLMRHLDDFSLAEKDIITKWTMLVSTRAKLTSSEFVEELRALGVH